MKQVSCNSVEEFERRIRKDMAALERNLDNSIQKAVRSGAKIVESRSPKAFGELRESTSAKLEARGGSIEVSAPHASAVEAGARPHWIPLDQLVKWVKLRGMQGLSTRFGSPAKIGTTTEMYALSIARQIKGMQRKGATPVDAPEQIARAIQHSIANNGVAPTWFVKTSLPELERDLANHIERALQ